MMAEETVATIAACATAKGRGGVAIIRISGPNVRQIMQVILGEEIPPRKAMRLPFRGSQQEIIDEGIALFFPKPHSFTGEDVLELHGHGGMVVVDLLLKAIVNTHDARLAEPGEFSLRAFLNNKIDLTQAEAIADLIDATSVQAARSAMRSLQGEFSKAIHAITERLIHTRIHIEAAIDFSDENIDLMSDGRIHEALIDVVNQLNRIQEKATQGSLLREGVNVVIAGKPNVGKSSLLNRLSGKDIAIVTNIPGTTRDIVRDDILIDGMPLHILDTAGLRDSHDVVEIEGMKRSKLAINEADLILYVTDEDSDLKNDDLQLACDARTICIRNKIDLRQQKPSIEKSVIALSAKTGVGIDLLIAAIKSKVGYGRGDHEDVFLARRRHLEALSEAKSHVENSLAKRENSQPELVAEELRLAQSALNQITGEFGSDDLLGRIFSSFCIGK